MRLQFLVFFVFLVNAVSAGIVATLPGYDDGHGGNSLPFTLETGYVGVGGGEKQLFYYFVQSQRDPLTDPILLWVSGGPGFSSLWGFFYINGPLNFNLSYPFDGSLPELLDNEYAWTKFMSILFVDGPAGTGFSYATTPEAYNTSNFLFAGDLQEFVHKWLGNHEEFRSNKIYFSGDGYSGNIIPILVDSLQKDNAKGEEEQVNVAGYLLVAPGTDFYSDFNSRIDFAYRMGLVAEDIYKPAFEACGGNYSNTNENCSSQVAYIRELISNINTAMILEPACGGDDQQIPPDDSTSLQHKFTSFLKLPSEAEAPDRWCRKYNHEICNRWVNYNGVGAALGAKENTKPHPWQLYNKTLDQVSFNKSDIQNLVPYHKILSKTDIDAFIMSGDHDMDIPNISIQKWIWSLELPEVERWRVVTVANETAGYTRKFESGGYSLTYASVKGAGHFTAEYKPEECYYMVYNWTNGLSL